MVSGPIQFLEPQSEQGAQVLQLYPLVELFVEGDPPTNALFVLGRSAAPIGNPSAPQEQLLLIDPPDDVGERFRLEGNVAVLFTGSMRELNLPAVRTEAGGLAHIRVGDHFLDIYSQQEANIVHFPALGILCAGDFGSDVDLPRIGVGSDGSRELDILRLLARLVKEPHQQLFIPRLGGFVRERVDAMQRLAADVAYLHGLRRVLLPLAGRDADETIAAAAPSLLPEGRRSALCHSTHETNLKILLGLS
jgi:hypothetical protein